MIKSSQLTKTPHPDFDNIHRNLSKSQNLSYLNPPGLLSTLFLTNTEIYPDSNQLSTWNILQSTQPHTNPVHDRYYNQPSLLPTLYPTDTTIHSASQPPTNLLPNKYQIPPASYQPCTWKIPQSTQPPTNTIPDRYNIPPATSYQPCTWQIQHSTCSLLPTLYLTDTTFHLQPPTNPVPDRYNIPPAASYQPCTWQMPQSTQPPAHSSSPVPMLAIFSVPSIILKSKLSVIQL